MKRVLVGFCCAVVAMFAVSGSQAATKMPTPTECKGTPWDVKLFSHKLFDSLLVRYVKNGLVNYNRFKSERRALNTYLCQLAGTDVKKIFSHRARFAFWINAYNALTIRGVLDRLPADAAAQKKFSVAAKELNFWKGSLYEVSGQWLSLDDIEHKILRPKFKDPRLHFAIVCASKGCPDLANRAYTGINVYSLMDKGTRQYMSSDRGFRKGNDKTIHLSQLFNWFAGDFAQKPYQHRLLFVAKFIPKEHQEFVKKNHASLVVKWLDYSWQLNVQ